MSYPPSPAQEPRPESPGPGRRRSRPVIGALAVALALAGGAVALTLSLDGDDEKPTAAQQQPSATAAESEPTPTQEPPPTEPEPVPSPSASLLSTADAVGVWHAKSDARGTLELTERDDVYPHGQYVAELYVDGNRCTGPWGRKEGETIIRLGLLCSGGALPRNGYLEPDGDTLTVTWIEGPDDSTVFTRAENEDTEAAAHSPATAW